MRSQMLTLVLAMGPAVAFALPASAHECSYGIDRPYLIEKTCDEDSGSCTARMLYAPGENPGLAGPGSYWYPRAERYVRVSPPECSWGHGEEQPHNHKSNGEGPAKQA